MVAVEVETGGGEVIGVDDICDGGDWMDLSFPGS